MRAVILTTNNYNNSKKNKQTLQQQQESFNLQLINIYIYIAHKRDKF